MEKLKETQDQRKKEREEWKTHAKEFSKGKSKKPPLYIAKEKELAEK